MRILKKSLACLLVAIIAMTAMFGCLVSAEETTTINGTIYVAGATVYDTTVDTIDVDVYVDAQAPISVARVKVNVPAKLGTITSATVSGEGVKAFEEDVEKDYNLATGTFLVDASDWEIGFTSAIITLTITLADNIAAGTYAVTAENITKVEGADWSENPCTFDITNGDVVVPYVLALDGDNLAITLAAGETATVMGTVNSAVSVVEATGAYYIGYGRQPINGDFMLSPWGGNTFTVTNNAEEAITVTLKNYSLPTKGTMEDPEIITENKDYTANVALNHVNDNYIYSFTAAEAGTVTVTMKSDTWFYTIYNENTYVQTDDQHYAFEGVASTTVDVAAGDVLSIKVNTGTYAPGEVIWNFEFKKAVTGPVVDNTIVFKDKIVNIGACLEFRFRITKSTVSADYDSIDFVVIPTKYDTVQGNAFNEIVLEPIVLPDEGKASGNYYTYWYRDIAMFELGLNITAYMRCYKDGEVVATSEILDIVPADYLIETQYVTVGATQKVKTIIADLLNMGAKAQTYFGASYTSSKLYSDIFDAEGKVIEANLVNARIDQADASTTYDELLSENTTTWGANNPLDAAQYRMKASLVASKSPTITYRIYKGTTLDADKMSLTITYVSNSGETKTFTKTGADMYANGTSLYYDCVDLAYYDSDVTVTTRFDYDGVEVWTNVYSVSAGVNELLGSATGTLADLLNSIAIFGTSARVYTGYGA